ncbi:Hypothetical predicted protein [Pelobates cultripes]|uniref:Uncharacterized protein n=1 Tax=Pelobates cultripes TaxID=61616 RepID=A0AAD1VRW5_PELCU|nr:Hypothetical predicted protein [Pelobates cultripes]
MPRGPREETLIKLDAIFKAFWCKLEERQQSAFMQGYAPPAADSKRRNKLAPGAHKRVTSTRRPHTTGVSRSSAAAQALTHTKKRRTVRNPAVAVPHRGSHRRGPTTAQATHLKCHIQLHPNRRIIIASLKAKRSAGHCRLVLAVPYRQQHNTNPLRDLVHHKEKHQGGGCLSQAMANTTPQACTHLSSPGTDKALHPPCLTGHFTDRDCVDPLKCIG